MSELAAEYAITCLTTSVEFDFDAVNAALVELQERCRAFREGPGAGALEASVELSAEARYLGQTWEIAVPVRVSRFGSPAEVEGLRQDFHAAHAELFAVQDPDSPIELVTWHARVACRLRGVAVPEVATAAARPHASRGRRPVYYPDTGLADASIVFVEELGAGDRVEGPAIVESPVTTVVLEPGASAERRPTGSLSILPWSDR